MNSNLKKNSTVITAYKTLEDIIFLFCQFTHVQRKQT